MKRKSQFATALASLMDESDLFSRQEWADILGISDAAISQWLNDKTLPSPEFLRAIVSTVRRNSNKLPHWILTEFDKMASKSASEVSPFGARIGKSVYEYLLKPLQDGFWEVFEALPVNSRERLLPLFSEMCMEEAGVFSPEEHENTPVPTPTKDSACNIVCEGTFLNEPSVFPVQNRCLYERKFFTSAYVFNQSRSRQSVENAFTHVLRKAVNISQNWSMDASFPRLRRLVSEERRIADTISLKILLSWFGVALDSASAVSNQVHLDKTSAITYALAENAVRYGSDAQLACSLYETCLEGNNHDILGLFNFVNTCSLANNKERAASAWSQFVSRLHRYQSDPSAISIFACPASWLRVYKTTVVLCGDFRALSDSDLDDLTGCFDEDAAFSAISKGEIKLLEWQSYSPQPTLAKWNHEGWCDFMVSDSFKEQSAEVFVYGPMQDLLQTPGLPLVRIAVSLVALGTRAEHAWRIAQRLQETQTLIFVHSKNILTNSVSTNFKEKLPYGFSIVDIITGNDSQPDFKSEAARTISAGAPT